MAPWWPFQRGSDASAAAGRPSNEAVHSDRGLHETEAYENRTSGKERNYGDSAVAVSAIDRMRDEQKIRRHTDGRAAAMDVESIDCLLNRFEGEFRAADAHMKERVAQQHALQRYDYENDQRYQQWREDQAGVRERLHIHPLDTAMDESYTCLVYYLRVFTTAGLCYGAGRSAYLYRTMDKTYAKLNGVSLGGIAFNEITNSVAKSAAVAVAGSIGVAFGDAIAGLCTMLATGDVSRPGRAWWNILSAGTTSGLCCGAAFVTMQYKDLTPWGMRALLGAFTGAGTLAGLYLGYCVYRPYAAQRGHDLYVPYWRPWQTRSLRDEGPSHVRGKYL